MHYVIFDLEFNQSTDNKEERKVKNNNLLFEIIQIGAIKIDTNLNIVSKFNALIKPTLYESLHPYVEHLTKININELNAAKTFPEVYSQFIKFIGNDNVVLVVWGISDIKELIRNAIFHNLPVSILPKNYIDIQKYASKYFKYSKGLKVGLKPAVELLKIDNIGDFHDAYFDAFYTFKVFKKIFNTDIEVEVYNFEKSPREKKTKEFIDVHGLFNQFEKIFNRNLTKDEKSMIRTAYMMGRTKQFIKNSSEITE